MTVIDITSKPADSTEADAPIVKLFGQPGCVGCTFSERKLNELGIPFEKIDVSVDDAGMAEVRRLGYQSVPVTVVGDEHWGGFIPDRLKALAAA